MAVTARRSELPHRLVCAWCTKVLREGKEPLSHGLCPACERMIEPRPFDILPIRPKT